MPRRVSKKVNGKAAALPPRDGLITPAQLGQKLKELFDEVQEPLPQNFVELLASLARKERGSQSNMEAAMLALVPNLRAFAYSLSGDHPLSDDLVQETLLKAWGHLDSFEEGTNLRAWLFTILRNTFFTAVRKRRREVEDADGKKAASLTVAPNQHGVTDLEDLRRAMEALPLVQKEALILVAGAGLSYDEAADIACCAVGTIKSRVSRARESIAESLGVTTADAFGPDFATTAVIGKTGQRH